MAREPGGRAVLGVASAVGVPAALLWTLSGPARRHAGLAAVPFGPTILLVAHLAAALPAGWVLARSFAHGSSRPRPLAGAVLGVFEAVVLGMMGPILAGWLDFTDSGIVARSFVRSALSVLLVSPWLLPWASRPVARSGFISALAAGAILAVLPPLAFATRLAETRSTEAAADLETGRLAKASRTLWALQELGASALVSATSPAKWLEVLRLQMEALEQTASQSLAQTATTSARIDRAFVLIQLNRLAEAEKVLKPAAASGDIDASLLLAAVHRDEGHWVDSERLYRQLLDRAPSGHRAGAARVDQMATAYDGLADVLTAAGRPDKAGRVLLDARRRLSSKSSHYAFRLGVHDLDHGRPFSALEWFDEAIRQDARFSARVEPLRRQALVRTPACLISR